MHLDQDTNEDLIHNTEVGNHSQITFEVHFDIAYNVSQHESHENMPHFRCANSTSLLSALERQTWDDFVNENHIDIAKKRFHYTFKVAEGLYVPKCIRWS